MSVDLEMTDSAAREEQLLYRPLSTAAVASLVVGLLSSMALLGWALVIVPVVGLILGVYAMRTVKHRANEMSGLSLARAGFACSLVFLLTGTGRLTHEYVTEVPDGYTRISYAELQPNEDNPSEVVPASARALDGQRVFIKGYIYPGRETEGIKTFLLCRDQGDCCFGGNPKITERVQVTLVDPLRLTYRQRLHKVAGTFHVREDAQGAYYFLDADYLQ